MLIQLTVGNFLSFREKTTFSMVASPDEPGHEDRVVKINDNLSVLRVAAIYGANASGKSNLLKAMAFAQKLIIYGTRGEETIEIEPFLLNEGNKTKPSFFEFIFELNQSIYSYGFTCTSNQIFEEWLKDATSEHEYFKRSQSSKSIFEFDKKSNQTIGTSLDRLQFLAEGTRSNQLFLTESSDRKVKLSNDISRKLSLGIVFPDSPYDNGRGFLVPFKDEEILSISNLLNKADTGITGVRLVGEEIEEVLISRKHSQALKLLPDEIVSIMDITGSRKLYRYTSKNKFERIIVSAKHINGSYFQPDQESEGTQRLIDIWTTVLSWEINSRSIVIDGIDRSLHPELVRFIFEYWLETSHTQSQLIFTTHNDNLLEDDLLRRDEVWLVTKNKDGASELASLVEYKIAPGTNLQKAYLHGWFNGVPRLGARRFYHTIREEENHADPSP